MKSNNPAVSVVIPVYNGAKYITDAVKSVLDQNVEGVELIVIDDGSTDGSAGIIKKIVAPNLRYVFQNRQGSGAARNTGVQLGRGEYIAFLDADDLWMDGKLKRQIKTFQDHPGYDMVFGHVEFFMSEDIRPDLKRQIQVLDGPLPGYLAGTMMIRRVSFERIGMFEIGWRVGEFVDWLARSRETGLKSIMLPDVLLKRRVHNSNSDYSHKKADYVSVVKASLERKRKKVQP